MDIVSNKITYSRVFGLLGRIIEKFNYGDKNYHLIINNQIHLLNTHDNNLNIHSGDLTFGIDATLGYISLGNIYSLLLLEDGSVVVSWSACSERLESEVDND